VSLASFFRKASSTLKVVPDKVKFVPPVYVVLLSVAVTVTAPVAPLIEILLPATIEVTPEFVIVDE